MLGHVHKASSIEPPQFCFGGPSPPPPQSLPDIYICFSWTYSACPEPHALTSVFAPAQLVARPPLQHNRTTKPCEHPLLHQSLFHNSTMANSGMEQGHCVLGSNTEAVYHKSHLVATVFTFANMQSEAYMTTRNKGLKRI